jgi:hypothetical protein
MHITEIPYMQITGFQELQIYPEIGKKQNKFL